MVYLGPDLARGRRGSEPRLPRHRADNRGNGESQLPVEGFRISDYASDLVGLIRSRRSGQARCGGQLVGRQHRHLRSAEYPERVSKVVLADPVYWKMVDAFATVVPAVSWRLERPEEAVRAGALASGATPEAAEREVYINCHFSPEVLRRIAVENRDWALACEDYLARAAAPTLLLVAGPGRRGIYHRDRAAAPGARSPLRSWRRACGRASAT